MKSAAARAVVYVGVLYVAAGIILGALAGKASSHQAVIAWRRAAWIVSAVAFSAHIVYEQVRLRSSPRISALHVASAAALGAFGLAAAANIHARTLSPPHHSLLLLLALAIWPVMTMVPAFLVALVAAILFARARPSA